MPQPEKMPINQQLRNERLQRHWSQQELADQLGTTVISIKRWERNITSPSPYFRLRLTALFGKSAEELGLFKEEGLLLETQKSDAETPALEDSDSSDDPLFPSEKDVYVPALSAEQASMASVSVALREQNQARMIELVSTMWITGMLEQSLHGAVLQTLELYEQPRAVENPWRLSLQEMERPEQLLPAGTSIVQVYDAVGGHLLILGDPGSGKTTLLLELARTMLNRARQDPTHPIPVIFNLSSWNTKWQSFEGWMIEELQEKYQVPRTLARQWMSTDTLIPLLDGLDEVAEERRSACVEVMNRYRQNHGLVPTVVCSRHADYVALESRIHLRSAVILQPLQPQQIADYLLGFGEKIEGLRRALEEDEELQKLATSPFMLNILTLTYADSSQKEVLEADTQEDRRHSIFARYVERMLKHRGLSQHSTSQQMMAWLIFLAKQLMVRQETVFYVERIQFDWLAPNRIRHLLPAICIGCIQGIFIGIVLTFFCLLFHSIKSTLIIAGVLTLWNIGFGILLNCCLLEWSHRSERQNPPIHQPNSFLETSLQLLNNRVVYGIVFAILNTLIIGLLFGLLGDLHLALQEALKYGLFYGSLIGGALLVQGPVLPIIQPAETVIWSWKTMRRNALRYVTIGVAVGFLFGLIYPLAVDLFLIVFAILGSVIAAGVSHKALEPHQRIRPNQGIRRSGRNSFQAALVAGGFTSIMLSISFGYFYGPLVGVLYSLTPAAIVSVCFAFQRGGTAYLFHFIVRGLLWWEGKLPWHYARFLDEAVDHIFLRKVGGGYIFIHRYVLEYFASLETIEPALTEKQRQGRRRLLQGSLALTTGGTLVWWALADLLPDTLGTPLYTYVNHTKSVNSIAISPDSRYVASGSDDTTVRIWNALDGTDLAIFDGQVPITTLAWSPDGTRIAIGKKNGVFHLWDGKNHALLSTNTTSVNEGTLQDIQWSPDGQMLAIMNSQGTVHIWQRAGKQIIMVLKGWSVLPGRTMTWSPDSRRLAFVAMHNTVSIWNVEQQHSEKTLTIAGSVHGIAWSPDGKTLAACVYEGWVQTWNITTYLPKNVYKMGLPETACVCWSPDNQYLIISGGHQGLQIWDSKQNTSLSATYDYGGIIHDVQYALNKTFFALAVADATIRIQRGR